MTRIYLFVNISEGLNRFGYVDPRAEWSPATLRRSVVYCTSFEYSTTVRLVNPPARVQSVPVDVSLVLLPEPNPIGVQFVPHFLRWPALTITNLDKPRWYFLWWGGEIL